MGTTSEIKSSMEAPSTVGPLLREGRLRQHLSITECAKRTHISPQYLEALELEKWQALPSESHRVGFLRLYARFLGISSEDVVQLYQKTRFSSDASVENSVEQSKVHAASSAPLEGHIFSWQQAVLLLVLVLLVVWGTYHALARRHAETDIRTDVWARFHPHHSRLQMNRSDTPVQKIHIQANADAWIRVTNNQKLLYEGILPAGNTREWRGPGLFQIKVGNIQALSVFWNDQLVDLAAGTHGHANEITLPPSSVSGHS